MQVKQTVFKWQILQRDGKNNRSEKLNSLMHSEGKNQHASNLGSIGSSGHPLRTIVLVCCRILSMVEREKILQDQIIIIILVINHNKRNARLDLTKKHLKR